MPSETIYFDKLTWDAVQEYVESDANSAENVSQAVQDLIQMGEKMNELGSDAL